MRKIIKSFKTKKIKLISFSVFAGAFLSFMMLGHYKNLVQQEDELIATYKDNLRYDQVCWLTSHNSFAYKHPSFKRITFAPANQDLTIKEQLKYGVRSFMIDLYYKDGKDGDKEIVIAHVPDLPDFMKLYMFEQPFLPFLQTIKKWLDDHPRDIITVHFESYIKDYGQLIYMIKNDAKLESYLYDPKHREKKKKWPTLKCMRDNNKRLVIFSDKIEDDWYRFSNKHPAWYRDYQKRYSGPKYSDVFGIIHTDIYMETEYNLAKYSNCEMRSDGRASEAKLFVMNHFYPIAFGFRNFSFRGLGEYLIPNFGSLNINKYDELRRRICTCFSDKSELPNFIAMDFIGSDRAEKDIIVEVNRISSDKNNGEKIKSWCSSTYEKESNEL